MKRFWPLVLSIAAYFIAVVIWTGVDRNVAPKAFDSFSAVSTDKTGLSLAARYLKASLLTRPLAAGTVEHNAVVFRVGELGGFAMLRNLSQGNDDDHEKQKSSKTPKKPEAKRHRQVTPLLNDNEEAFVRDGGRLILAPNGALEPLSTRNSVIPVMTKVFPLWPGLASISMPEPRTLAGPEALRRAHVLYVAGDKPAIIRLIIGKGDLIITAQPELLDNAHIASPASLSLLTALAGEYRPIYFDETVHGLMNGGGTLDLLRQWNLGPFLLLLVICAMVFWRHGRRIGSAEGDRRETRSDAVDLVRALGALYDRSMTDGEAIELYYQALSRSVAAHTGLRGDALHQRVSALTLNMHVPWKHEKLDASTFHNNLTTINEAFRRTEH